MAERTDVRDVVLVVDDSPAALSVLTEALDRAGMTVMVALDGTSALRIAQRLPPDVILLDAVMPGIDGFETCRRLKADADLQHVPVIFMTGLRETEHIVAGLAAGGVDYVAKPIVIEEMLARIRVHLANARAARSAREALDASGSHLLAVDRAGRILWLTPQAKKHLLAAGLEEGAELTLPPAAQAWLRACASDEEAKRAQAPRFTLGTVEVVTLTYVARTGSDELLLRVLASAEDAGLASLKSFRLTLREQEVLGWIVKGKSNRDTAEILGLSIRTVDKHLEQVYAKLGVDNRTAATAMVLSLMGRAQAR